MAACSDDHNASTPPPPQPSGPTGEPPVATTRIDAIDNTFRDEVTTIAAGTEVVWVNAGRNDHNVLPSVGDAWGVQKDAFKPGAEYRYVFTEPGTYEYVCTIHGVSKDGTKVGMYGTIIVT